jgi:hypothetical protein
MAKRSFSVPTFTPTGSADNAVIAGGWMAIGAAAATNGLLVYEIYQGGQAAATAVNAMVFARDSTLGATLTALAAPNTDGPLSSLSAAAQSGSLTFIASTTVPIRSNVTTSAKLALSFNPFGGIVRWLAAPGEEWAIVGITASISESSLSALNVGTPGLQSAHIVYEAY